jgi:hypothetical protein
MRRSQSFGASLSRAIDPKMPAYVGVQLFAESHSINQRRKSCPRVKVLDQRQLCVEMRRLT